MNEDIAGKYIHRKIRSNYIELTPDGTYSLREGSTTLTGTYEVNGAEIRIIGDEAASRARVISPGVIVDSEGERWIRADATDDPLPSMTWIPAVLRSDAFPWEFADLAFYFLIAMVLFVARA
jgi:hypothetical protein